MPSPEILMKMVVGKAAVEGESLATFDINDDLMAGFQRGRILELMKFDFDVSIEDDDSAGDDFDDADGDKPTKKKKKKKGAAFKRWLGGDRDLKKEGYPVELKPFGFTRQLDKASPRLFEMACNSQSFTTVTVVKRKTLGLGSGKPVSSHGYLRFDFEDVLLTKLKWDLDEALVTEDCDFICRKVLVQYRPQLSDGTLGDIIPGFYQFDSTTKG